LLAHVDELLEELGPSAISEVDDDKNSTCSSDEMELT